MAALNDKATGGVCWTAPQNFWIRRAPGWVVSEHMFDTNSISGTTSCIAMFKSPTTGLRIADWFVVAEQLDTNASPTLVTKIGLLNDNTTPTGLVVEWASSSTLGRAATSSMERNTNGLCALAYNRPSNDIGVHFSAGTATGAAVNKKIIMGVLFAPW